MKFRGTSVKFSFILNIRPEKTSKCSSDLKDRETSEIKKSFLGREREVRDVKRKHRPS
jgi:hypothetical protein